jgi:formylmethanofuran dehydrogenase subunit E
MKVVCIALAMILSSATHAETPEQWIALGARVHGGFGSFIPLGIRIGLDAINRLHAKPRELTVLYYDSDASPCACFADGVAIATYASVGQRTLTIAQEKAPEGAAAVIVIRPRQGGAGLKYTIPTTALKRLAPLNKDLDELGRYDVVMTAVGLYEVETIPERALASPVASQNSPQPFSPHP